jgi:hypothetical protein
MGDRGFNLFIYNFSLATEMQSGGDL